MEPRKAILILIYATSKADGLIVDDELTAAWDYNLLYLGFSQHEALDILNEYINVWAKQPGNDIIMMLSSYIPENMRYGTVEMLFHIADVDEEHHPLESAFIKTVCKHFKISDSERTILRNAALSKYIISLTTQSYKANAALIGCLKNG